MNNTEQLTIKVMADTSSLKREFASVKNDLGELGSKARIGTGEMNAAFADTQKKMRSFGDSVGKAGQKMTVGLTLPIIGIATAAANTGMKFEASMAKVSAISGATGADLQRLEDLAKQMGRTTKFSATESADALNFMAMAGWDTHEMAEALPAVLNLAVAAGTDLATTSDIITDSLTAFGLEAEDAQDFTDLLASAATNANTTVEGMGETFKYVAPLFNTLGYSAEDAALATGLMANAGIKGGQAGTALRSALSRLLDPSDEAAVLMDKLGVSLTDANGEMKPFDKQMKDLRESFGGLDKEQQAQAATTIFGREAMSGMLGIINASPEDFAKMTNATKDYNGAAQDMADIMSNTLEGRITSVKSALEGAAIQIFEAMLPALEKLVEWIQKVADWFSELDDEQVESIVKWGLVVAAIGPVLMIFGKLIGLASGISSVVGAVSGIATAAGAAGGAAGVGGLATALGGFAAAAAPFVAGAVVVGAAGYAIHKTLSEDVIPEVNLFADHVAYASETVTDEFGNITTTMTDATVVISEETQAQIGSFMELDQLAREAILSLYTGGAELTGEGWTNVRTAASAGIDMLLGDLEGYRKDSVDKLQELYDNNETLTMEEMAAIRKIHEDGHTDKKEDLEKANKRISEIMDTAQRERRDLTVSENTEINRLLDEAQETAVATYATSEAEKNVILNRLKGSQERVTAEMVSNTIQELNKQRDDTVLAASEQRDEQVRLAEETRAMGGSAAEDLADKMIEEANRQYDEVVTAAEGVRDDGVGEIMDAYSELQGQVDTDTGLILTGWGKLKKWWDGWFPQNKTMTVTTNQKTNYNGGGNSGYNGNSGGSDYKRNAAGTNFFKGGLTSINEVGGEIVDLPKGTRIIPHDISEKMAENSGKESVVINLNGNYGFKDKDDMDYFMNQMALVTRRA